MKLRGLCIVALLLIMGRGWAAETPVVERMALDAFGYADDAAARAVWTPIEGSLPVSVSSESVDGRQAMRLPADLTGERRRAGWDKSVALDLTRTDRFSFWLYVDDPSKVAPYISFYFGSGDGWYSASAPIGKGWRRITLDKSDFRTEGTPAGWSAVNRIRISAWKAKDAVTFLAVDDLEASSSSIVVVLGDRAFSGAGNEERTVRGQAEKMGRILESIGIESGALTDTDVESGALAGRSVAIFPYNPAVSDKESEAIETFVSAGGKVIFFYTAPARVLAALGMEETGWKKPEYEGQFARVTFLPGDIVGMPESFAQSSWNIRTVKPTRPSVRVAAEWRDAAGKAVGQPALVVGENGAFFSHVLLSGERDGGERMVLALLGRYVPAIWPEAARRALAASGTVGEFESAADVAAFVEKSGKPAARVRLASAKSALADAEAALNEKRYPDALTGAHRAFSEIARAYAAAQESRPVERRAVWCHSAFGVSGMSWDESAKALADNGMNTVVPNMLWGGVAYYPSRVLPVDASVATRGDQIAACVAAARKYGLEVHVWKVNWNLGRAPKAFLDRMRAEGRTQKDPKGGDIDWLCPSHPENQALELASMLEVARNYPVDGIHFDYIRYPGPEGCYCAGCRERFEKSAGVTVADWPADVVTGALKERYLDFRRANITRLVESVSREARRVRPGIKISAAVFSGWPGCRDSVGQDWVNWVKAGYLDFVCPMDYTPAAPVFEQWVTSQQEATGPAIPFIPGVGVTLDTWLLTPDQTIRQINIARKSGADGFILFDYQPYVAREILPALGDGVTSQKATPQETKPARR